MKKLLIVVIALTAVMQSWAQISSFVANSISYTFSGGMSVAVGKSEAATGEIIIPEKVKFQGTEYTVTAIGDNAFRDNFKITSVTLPKTIRSIGMGAFWRCKNLTKTNIPMSVRTVGKQAYAQTGLPTTPDGLIYIDQWLVGYGFSEVDDGTGKKVRKLVKPTGDVIIKDGTKFIAEGTFEFCSDMTSLIIPPSVVSIIFPILSNCNGLEQIFVMEGNTTYDSRENCNAIIGKKTNALLAGCQTTIIPNSVTSIGRHAFRSLSNLTRIDIPSSVTSIGGYAFQKCANLMEINIPKSVKEIGAGAFDGTAWYKAQADGLLYKDDWMLGYKGEKPKGSINIPKGTTHIIERAFGECSELKELVLPEGLSTVPSKMCLQCSGLKSVVIPEGVDAIGTSAFYGCTDLKAITIPNSVERIDYGAFIGCTSLKSIVIPEKVATIGNNAFANCRGLKTINIPASVTDVSLSAFIGTAWYSKQFDGSLYLDGWLLGYKGKEPSGKIVIKEGTRHIARSAFSYCSDLKTVVFPTSLRTIGYASFGWCQNLESVDISNGVEKIESMAFANCKKLTKLRIPESVTAVSSGSFYNTGWYDTQPNNEVIYLDNWLIGTKGERAEGELEIKPDTKGIASAAFLDSENLTSVTIPSSVKYVGQWAFYGCNSLLEVHISDLEAWKRIKFEDETANPTFYSKNLNLNGQTITEW